MRCWQKNSQLSHNRTDVKERRDDRAQGVYTLYDKERMIGRGGAAFALALNGRSESHRVRK